MFFFVGKVVIAIRLVENIAQTLMPKAKTFQAPMPNRVRIVFHVIEKTFISEALAVYIIIWTRGNHVKRPAVWISDPMLHVAENVFESFWLIGERGNSIANWATSSMSHP
jgi:hypothetical protein